VLNHDAEALERLLEQDFAAPRPSREDSPVVGHLPGWQAMTPGGRSERGQHVGRLDRPEWVRGGPLEERVPPRSRRMRVNRVADLDPGRVRLLDR
jgi:hypothetical protein